MRKASLRLLLLFALCAAAVVAFGGASGGALTVTWVVAVDELPAVSVTVTVTV